MSPAATERTAVVVDRHPLWLDSVEGVARRAGVAIALKTCSPAEALAVIEERRPDLLVTGVHMPEGEIDGLALVRRARELVPALKAMVLSSCDEADRIDAAFAAGAHSYVLKSAHPDDLAAAMQLLFRPAVYLGAARTAPPASAAPSVGGERSKLTRRELEILQLVAEGHSNAQLARLLWVTEQTVKFHLSNIYRKLGVANRTEASRFARVPDASGGTALGAAG